MESFGLTVREAQIRNKWVIATSAGGVIEDIIEGINGSIIPMSKDAAHLISAMKNIIDNPKIIDQNNDSSKRIVTFEEQSKDLLQHYMCVIE